MSTDIDPTRIDISSDPTERRFRGVAVHGNTPFDVPYISEIVPGLWQGGCENGLVLPMFVKHVVSLYPWEEYTAHHRLHSNLSVRMYDSDNGPDEEQLVAIAEWVNLCRKRGTTLVHCQAGLNRSGLVAGLALMLDGATADEAISALRECRSPAVLCNATFEQWLRAYGGDAS